MLEYGKHDNNRLSRNYLISSPNKSPTKNNPISDERYSQYHSSRNNNTFDKVSRYSNNLFDDKGQRSHYSRSYSACSPNKSYIIDGNNRSNEIADKLRLISSKSSSNIVRSGLPGLMHNAHQSASSDSSIGNLDRNFKLTFQNLLNHTSSVLSRGSDRGRIQSIKRRRFEDGSLRWDKEVRGNQPKKKKKEKVSSYVIDRDLIEDDEEKTKRKKEVKQSKNKPDGEGLLGNVGEFDGFSLRRICKGFFDLEDRCSSGSKINKDKCLNSVPLAQPKHIDVEHDSAFLKFDVFDYEHQNADVAKLPIVEPDLLPIGSPNKVVDVIENSQLLVQPKRIEVEKDEMFQKYDVFDYGHQDADINALPIIEPDLPIVDSLNKVRDKTDIPILAQPKCVEVGYDGAHQKSNGIDYDHQNNDIKASLLIHPPTSFTDALKRVDDKFEIESLTQSKCREDKNGDMIHELDLYYNAQNTDNSALPVIDPHLSLVDSSEKPEDKTDFEALAQSKRFEVEYESIVNQFDVFENRNLNAGISDLPIIDSHLIRVDSLNETRDKNETKGLAQPKRIEVKYDNLFQKFDVFDYGHQIADVGKLPIVDPLLPSNDLSNQVISPVTMDLKIASITSDSVDMISNLEVENVYNDMIDEPINIPLLDIPLPSTPQPPNEMTGYLRDLQVQLKELANLITIGSSVSVKTNNVEHHHGNNDVEVVSHARDLLPVPVSTSSIIPTDEGIIQLRDNMAKSAAKLAHDFNRACKKTSKQTSCNSKRHTILKEKLKVWKLITLDVPVRNAFTKDNVDISRCHPSDPRVTRF